MARVTFVTSICDEFTQGQQQIELAAGNVFQLVRQLDERFPGLGRFVEMRASIAVDGEVIHDWTQALTAEAEVLLFPRIAGGGPILRVATCELEDGASQCLDTAEETFGN